uniref:P-II family nitrogen regulator n=1 Tax=Acetatifactor sp. TaxID=1872090 RepID=UPI0040579E73
MGSLYMMTTIVNRKDVQKYLNLYQENNLHVMFLSLGFGTASNEVLDYLGLDSTEKAVAFSVLEENSWLQIKKQLEKKLKIDAPGGGIAFTIPLSSVGGKKTLQFLLESQNYQKEEESTMKDTIHQLIVVIAEQGYTEMIMDAAREAGAYGGTVIHAKGTGMQAADKFMGVSLAAEKEVIYIVTKTEQKNPIMQAIMQKAGLDSKAKSIVFSLPVTDTAG